MRFSKALGANARALASLFALIVVAVACVLGYAFLVRGNYQAEAVLRYDQPMSSYRRIAAQLGSEQSFLQWSAQQNFADADTFRSLRQTFSSRESAQNFVSAFFRLTRRDVREVVTAQKQEEGEVFDLAGLELIAFSTSSERAAALVVQGGAYVRDVALRDAVIGYVTRNRAATQEESRRIENDIIARRFEVVQLEGKRAELRRIQSLYPDAAPLNQRQLLSISPDGSRYLPPVVQLVGVETELIDKRRDLLRLERAAMQAKLLDEFFTGAVQAVERASDGAGTLAAVDAVRQRVLPDQAIASDDARKEVDNRIRVVLDGFRAAYVKGPVFVSGDVIMTGLRVRPSRLVILGVLVAVAVWSTFFFGPRFLLWLREGTRPQA